MRSMHIISASSTEFCICMSFAAATGSESTIFVNNTFMDGGSRSTRQAHLMRYSGRTLATRGTSERGGGVAFGQYQSFSFFWESIVFFK